MPASPTRLTGRYVRSVEVRCDDRVPFRCNQRPWYRQRAVFDVEVDITRTGFAIRETRVPRRAVPVRPRLSPASATTPPSSPASRLALRWHGGVADAVADRRRPRAAPRRSVVGAPDRSHGAWRWDATSFDDDGNVHDESEWWEITRRTETRLDATYRRRVTVRSPDGKPIACADAPSWTFDDAYVLDGQREEEHWHFHELAAEPGDHPCLRAHAAAAHLDEATAEQIGDYLVLEWRGKRRQVLYRRRSGRAEPSRPSEPSYPEERRPEPGP